MHLLTCVCMCVCDVVSERSLTKWCVVNTLDLEFLLFKRLEYCARKTPLMCRNTMCVCVFTVLCPVRCSLSKPALSCRVELKSHLMNFFPPNIFHPDSSLCASPRGVVYNDYYQELWLSK